MASLIDNLIKILEKENIEYEKLLDLSLNKASVIVKNEVDELQNIVTQEQVLLDSIDKLEKQREENIKDIGNVLNVPENELTIEKLAGMLKKQPKEQEQLSNVRMALKRTMQKLAKVNDSNKVLLQESIDMIEFELNLVRNTKMAPENANYSKGAYSTSQNPDPGVFDAKQ